MTSKHSDVGLSIFKEKVVNSTKYKLDKYLSFCFKILHIERTSPYEKTTLNLWLNINHVYIFSFFLSDYFSPQMKLAGICSWNEEWNWRNLTIFKKNYWRNEFVYLGDIWVRSPGGGYRRRPGVSSCS